MILRYDKEDSKLNFYFAPMEGITGVTFRNVHRELFPQMDRYYGPFIAATQTLSLKKKEIRDTDPDNNRAYTYVPQVLTNSPEQLLWAVSEMQARGYGEVNINLGCPSGTVVPKFKGAGMLGDMDRLDRFFDESFGLMDRAMPGWNRDSSDPPDRACADTNGSSCLPADETADRERMTDEIFFRTHETHPVRISVKTRIGLDNRKSLPELISIFNRYPFSEIIVHPRLRTDFYKGTPDMEAFQMCAEDISRPLAYNGDLFSAKDYRRITARFSNLSGVMMGRGLLVNPALVREMKGGRPLSKDELRRFHDLLFGRLLEEMQGSGNVLFRMKELWYYMGQDFPDAGPYIKKVKKAKTPADYRIAADRLFDECAMRVPEHPVF